LIEPPGECDFAVVGAGILGLAVTRELMRRHPGSSAVVLERASEVAGGQTGANSGVIHAGIYYAPGSLKARLCVSGAREMYAYCEEHSIPHERCGKLIVALHEGELGRLDELERRGRENEVPGCAAFRATSCASSSRTAVGWRRCTRRPRASSISARWRGPSPEGCRATACRS